MKNKKNIAFFDRELLAKYLSNEVTPVEKSEVEAWIDQSEENREELEQIRKMLDSVDAFYNAEDFNSVAAWEKVQLKMHTPQLRVVQKNNVRKEVISHFYKVAAILVFAVLLGSAGYYFGFRNKVTEVYSEIISAEKQVIKEYLLPDGSVVALNSNSKLVFPRNFTGDTREVTIYGEAFFDVKPDASKPFIINAGNAQVKVLGTSFNVKADRENGTVEVVVATGKVQVTGKTSGELNDKTPILLVPGEKGIVTKIGSVTDKMENNNPNYLAWKTHDFVFNEVALSEVIATLESTYHVDIEVAQPKLNELKLTAHFENKPIDFVLNVVRLTFNLDLSEENEQFTLSGRGKNE
jgi:ferric-dicitrate binding protein FerR (iron transport regulator)